MADYDGYFEYGAHEIDALKIKDPKLGEMIDRIGPLRRGVTPDLFEALVGSIVGQQISGKAERTILGRMESLVGTFTPERIAAHTAASIQACGMTMKKAVCIKEAARKVVAGEFDLEALRTLPDDEVQSALCTLDGVGVWTAEMLLLFSMRRPDVFSFGDLAIHRGLRMLHRHRKIDRKLFEKYRRRYSPHGSVASLYLWEIASGACGLTDCAVSPKIKTKKKRAPDK